MKRRASARIRELGLGDGATEIAMISRFDLFFQSLRDYFGDVSEFHFFCRFVIFSEIVDPSKGKVLRGSHRWYRGIAQARVNEFH
jgi:hypothetical protein